MIRIRTKIGDKQVSTILYNGKWQTLAPNGRGGEATNLLDAGQNHLQAALQLRKEHGKEVSS